MLKDGVLDPQGKAIGHALRALGVHRGQAGSDAGPHETDRGEAAQEMARLRGE